MLDDEEFRVPDDAEGYVDAAWDLGNRTFRVWLDNFRTPRVLEGARRAGTIQLTVAVDRDQQVVGLFVMSPQRGQGNVVLPESLWAEGQFIAVAEGYRGRHIGTRLHDSTLAVALRQGRLGIMGTIRPETAGFVGHRGWEIARPWQHLVVADIATAETRGIYSWWHQADDEYPIYVWRQLDAARPVRAFPTFDNVSDAVIAAEIERQRRYLE